MYDAFKLIYLLLQDTGDCSCLHGVGGINDTKCCHCSFGYYNLSDTGCTGNSNNSVHYYMCAQQQLAYFVMHCETFAHLL